MDPIYRHPNQDNPKVVLDKERDTFQLEGFSMCENAVAFYEPLIEWVREYVKNPNKTTVFELRMRYFNTSSSKMIQRLLHEFDRLHAAKHDIVIEWHYSPGDEDMIEAGEIYASMLSCKVIKMRDYAMLES